MSVTSNVDLLRYAQRWYIPLTDILSKDQLPKHIPYNSLYIINMQNNKDSNGRLQNGTHWVALYVENGQISYMDSYGLPPPVSVQERFKNIIYNAKQIQSSKRGYCGLYSLYFLYFMLNHKGIGSIERRMKYFQKLWSKNLIENEKKLKGYLHIQ